MDIPGQSSLLEATRLAETAFSAMEVSGAEAADKTPSPGAGSEFLVDEEAASTCPLLTPSPPAGAFHISLTAVARPTGMAYDHQISPSITDPELSSSLPGLDDAPGFTALNDASIPAHDSSPAIEDGPSGAFPGVAATLESSSSSSSVLHEPTVCAQLLNSHHYAHLAKGSDVATFVCQENGGKSPLSAIQLAVSPSAKNYPFLNWNWRIIRRISFLGAMSLIVATACAVIAIMVSIPKSCKPAHEWWQGTLFYEIFPASFMDSNADGVGDFPGMLQHMKYLDNLGVRVVHLNSIFAADHYPDHFAHPKNLLEIDPSLGTLKDFQAVVSILHQRNISVVVDLPIAEATQMFADSEVTTYNDTYHEETYTKAIFASAEDDVIAEAVEFWLNQGIDGFYLKGLEYVVHGSDFADSIIRWRKLVDKFPNRILMCSMAAIDALDFDANLRHIVLSRMDLVDVYINISSANAATEIKEHVNKIFFGPVFGSPNYPWIHWNMGSVETERLVNRLQTANGSLAALLFNMMLPGTTSVFYGDEIGLENYHNIESQQISQLLQALNTLTVMRKSEANVAVPAFRQFDSETETWDQYLQQLLQHFAAYNIQGESRKSYLLAWLGPQLYALLTKLFPASRPDSCSFDEIIQALSHHYDSEIHIAVARYKFFRCAKRSDQTYKQWLADLRGQTRSCKFQCQCGLSFADEMIRDAVTQNVTDERVRSKILQHKNPSLDEVVSILEQCETFESAVVDMQLPVVAKVDATSHRARDGYRGRSHAPPRSPAHGKRRVRQQSQKQNFRACPGTKSKLKSCPQCFVRHDRRSCPQKSASCYFCHKIGHIQQVCQQKNRSHAPKHFNKNSHFHNQSQQCEKMQVNMIDVHVPSRPRRRRQSRRNGQNHRSDQNRQNKKNKRFSALQNSTPCAKVRKCKNNSCAMPTMNNSTVNDQSKVIRHSNKLFIPLQINGHVVQFQLDTGASLTLINKETYNVIGAPPLQCSNRHVTTYDGARLDVLGTCVLDAKYKNTVKSIPVTVLRATSTQNIFGLDAFDIFGLHIEDNVLQIATPPAQSEIDKLCSEFKTLFDGTLGCAKDFAAHITLKQDAHPKFCRARPVPHALREKVATELRRLQEIGVLEPITASQWASPIVVVSKPNGSTRVCVDFKRTVNSQTIVDTFPLPRPEDLLDKLQAGAYFSKIDLQDAYLQIPLDKDTQNFMVINTHIGLFRFLRLPFGSSSAPALFQKYLEQLLSNVPNCATYLDDILVSGTSPEDHLRNLRNVFSVLAANGLKCNRAKCVFFVPQVEYLGHVIDASGIRPAKKHLEAIRKLPAPRNVSELQSVLGKLSYYIKFIPNAAQIAAPLHRLRRKHVEFQWTQECNVAFQKLKNALLSEPCLKPFDPAKPLILATDASSIGIAAVLSHRVGSAEHPIAFASKLLNSAQRNYSQIEKEALAIIFGVTKFNQYLYGRKFILITDHKPLTSLFHPTKSIPDRTAQKLQRWALILSNYNYDIVYRPTSKHANADTLSRLPLPADLEFDSSEIACCQLDHADQDVLQNFPLDSRIIASATARDPKLRLISQFISRGWPSSKAKLSDSVVRRYFPQRHALTLQNGVILLHSANGNTRVLVPRECQAAVLKQLHAGHWGMVRTKQLARRHCTWYGLDSDIERITAHCRACSENAAAPRQQTFNWPRPTSPWERLHIDFCGPFWDTRWLVVVDAYSKFPFCVPMRSTTSAHTIRALETIFCLEGLPKCIVSDNGPQFVSSEFRRFCSANGIKHVTSAPFSPQSNGEAERFVRTFKTQMSKLRGEHSREDALLMFLSSYRSMPAPDKSPAELLHGRAHATLLSLMHPRSVPTPSQFRTKFDINDKVFFRIYNQRHQWAPGTVVGTQGRAHFHIRSLSGYICRRHVNQLRPRSVSYTNDSAASFSPTDPGHSQLRSFADRPVGLRAAGPPTRIVAPPPTCAAGSGLPSAPPAVVQPADHPTQMDVDHPSPSATPMEVDNLKTSPSGPSGAA